MKETVFVLHEFGAPTHYLALSALLSKHDGRVVFRELDFLSQFVHSLTNPRRGFKLLLNIWFVLTLGLRCKSTIILAIAPCNRKLRWLRTAFHRHSVFYHTSHVEWNGSCWVHRPTSEKDVDMWRHWLSTDCRGIFAVTKAAKISLVVNGFARPDQVFVVAHSFDYPLQPLESNGPRTSFLCVARLEPCKGILELLPWFRDHPEASLTIIGGGRLENSLRQAIVHLNNVRYLGRLKNLEELCPIYQRHAFLILNSIRTGSWEEFFGMAIIEAMACGCIPIATDHSGPKEIITNGENGFLVKEGHIEDVLSMTLAMEDVEYEHLRHGAIRKGGQYESFSLSSRWSRVLDELRE